jgi:UDP-N-acetylmuramyl pentapeptide phosphotransferase/UDP-N-acetylglucosamine-1-phosphate transferase
MMNPTNEGSTKRLFPIWVELLYSSVFQLQLCLAFTNLGLSNSGTSWLPIINATNLIDGIDGLAASIGIFSSVIFGVKFLIISNPDYAIFSFAIIGEFIGFSLV